MTRTPSSRTGLDPVLAPLLTCDAAAADAFFADVPAEDLVAAVTRTGDDELRRLIDRAEVRAAAVPGILHRLDEYAIPERLAEIHGTIRFDLERDGIVIESHAVALAAGAIELVADVRRARAADVVLRTSVLRFVRTVSGEENAGLAFLAGHLDIDGDAMLALAVGGVFKVPGLGTVAVDPTTLDPGAVAAAVAVASPEHLRKVMASGFRPVVLGEIFRRLPDFVHPRKASGPVLVIGFRLTGGPGGEIERYVVRLDGGVATVLSGDEAEAVTDRQATITIAGHDFLKLALGQLSAITGVLRGQLKVKGDRAKALQFSSVIEFPSAS